MVQERLDSHGKTKQITTVFSGQQPQPKMAAILTETEMATGCGHGELRVYWMTVSLSAPGIAYSMLGWGLLEFGGVVHALMAGVYAIPFWILFNARRSRRLARMEEPVGPISGHDRINRI